MHCPCLNTLSCLSTCFLFDFTQRIQWIKNITRGSALSKNTQACPVRAKAGGQPSRSGGGRGEWDRGSVESETGGRAEQLQVNTRDRTAETDPRTLWISSTICWHSEWQTPRETRRWAGLFSHANKSAKLDLLTKFSTHIFKCRLCILVFIIR